MQRPRSPFFLNFWGSTVDNSAATPVRGSSRRAGHILYPFPFLVDANDYFEDYDGFSTDTRDRDLLVSRSLDNDESYEAPINITAVLGKCRKVVHNPTTTTRRKGKAETDQNECPVCLEKFVAGDQLLSLPCNHRFHSDCLIPWIKTNHARCPCCRADILTGPKKNEERAIPRNVSARNYGSSNNGRSSGSFTLRNVPIMVSRRSSATSGDRLGNTGGEAAAAGRGEGGDDVMAILLEMEAALNRWGLIGL